MALIKWDDSLSVNVAEIDKQHQKLIEMINELSDAMRQRKGKDILDRIISGLMGYAETHFKVEEKYFEQFGYPETSSHKKEHLYFEKKVSEFKKKFENGTLALSVDVMTFLSNWLQDHIKTVDKRYGPFFNEKGLK